MGQARSKETRDLTRTTHFSSKEINNLRNDVESSAKQTDQSSITENVFKEAVKKYVPSVSSSDDVFLKRLYAAFDVNNNQSLDFGEFVDGLSVFMKGTADEKMALSFKLYDIDHDGYLTRSELERVMLQLSHTFSEEDQASEIQQSISRMFDDLDVDGDGKLSFEEYKLSSLKEPMIVDFLEHFLDQHHLSNQPRPPSRPPSVISYRSNLSAPRRPSPHHNQRLSIRLSQAELLEYSLQQQQQRLGSNSPSSSPRSSLNPSHSPSSSTALYPARIPNPHRLSRGTSMVSLDAAISSI
ncbi:hypothetical protein PHYBLDRAFT_157210 [Phycomyces blakesleeanus NRRL 1555(-)]|uniref:EF-hand domain-containing protein n=2 Tax=Phycomyces blakesleeanus TaxID=4837 RepID=A0A167Q978_PHYB8|nr:hypothetical protein PHYBLDRAFT_157210 [Phycomyces blakesleeanus NRRL 1555(-)]OAD79299.1 hypothetical protein PHYBLDRAFT_157210 [Phycomyces blakesleeanus NRRL 1555(-)]|eukprot:XP_018297339.1 hypothetical protein PHYBLDRAFT_157210 [Phycomyces blakesleeanus NRRL 1555(-)]